MDTFKVIQTDKDSKARVGELMTRKGVVRTPFFMPVATKATGKYLSSKDIEEIGSPAVISNSFILSLRPGADFIEKMGGVGKFMDYKGVNVTDSGGFQMYSPSFYKRSTEEGAFFSNPLTGEEVFMSPEKNMELQKKVGADIIMCFDRMPLIEDDVKEIEEAVKKTTLWAGRCKVHLDKLQKKVALEKRQLLFCISQGGIHTHLREQSVKGLIKGDFDGYAIGGLALGEERKDELKMVDIHTSLVGKNKPVYLMGVGHPVEMLEAIKRGVDMFDSRYPTKNARHGTLLTSKGSLRVDKAEFKHDGRPIDEDCTCYVCKRYSRAYVRYQLIEKEGVGFHLASYHNIYYLTRLMEQAQKAIIEGTFVKLLKKTAAAYSE